MVKPVHSSDTRRQILRAALKQFAYSGYAASSVQKIVDEAKVSKPALYYHFSDKAGLFQALVDLAHDERYRIIQEAIAKSTELKAQLTEILAALFAYLAENRDLVRIAFSTAFAAPGEVPEGLACSEKCERNFELIHSVLKSALERGVLNKRFDSRELAYSFYGLVNSYMASHLLMPDFPLDRRTAGRIVELFLTGAAARKRAG